MGQLTHLLRYEIPFGQAQVPRPGAYPDQRPPEAIDRIEIPGAVGENDIIETVVGEGVLRGENIAPQVKIDPGAKRRPVKIVGRLADRHWCAVVGRREIEGRDATLASHHVGKDRRQVTLPATDLQDPGPGPDAPGIDYLLPQAGLDQLHIRSS